MNARMLPPTITFSLTDLAGRKLRVEKVPCMIGRKDADLLVEHASVSSRHAALDITSNGPVIVDNSSTNGTFVNGFRITASTPLKTGDEVLIGQVAYIVEFTAARGQAAPPPVDPNNMTMVTRAAPKVLPIGGQRAVVLLVSFAGKQRQHVLENRITSVGRQECDVTIDDPALSRKHMQIEVYNDAFGLKDLASANGTFVNGKPISYLKVPGEVTFTAGASSFKLFIDDQHF